MASQKKIIAVIGEADFSHAFFTLMGKSKREKWIAEVEAGRSTPITFFNEDGKVLFYSLMDIHNECVHVHLLIGHFFRLYQYVSDFFLVMAQAMGKKSVSFHSDIDVIKLYGEKLGYSLNSFGDYEKAVV